MNCMHSVKAIIVAIALAACIPCTASADDYGVCQAASGDEAITACDRAIASGQYRGSKLSLLYVWRGAEMYTKHEDDKALEDYTTARDLDPSSPSIYNNIGLVQRRRGQTERAIENFDKAIELDSKYTAAYTNRGLAYEEMKDYDRARRDFQHALDVPPKWNDGEWAQRTARARLEELKDK